MLRVSGGSNSIKVERRTQRESSDNWGRVRRRWIPQDLTCNLLVNSRPCPMGESGGDDNVERPVCTQYQEKQGVRLSYQLEGWGRGLVGGGGICHQGWKPLQRPEERNHCAGTGMPHGK
ncbi:hypothetical protein EDD17DRAFT_1503831 [Pisolithus thermaeus]|nr:hypothetical protein EDD17DRAFT_1503831 [Pisolithus thermaeus]